MGTGVAFQQSHVFEPVRGTGRTRTPIKPVVIRIGGTPTARTGTGSQPAPVAPTPVSTRTSRGGGDVGCGCGGNAASSAGGGGGATSLGDPGATSAPVVVGQAAGINYPLPPTTASVTTYTGGATEFPQGPYGGPTTSGGAATRQPRATNASKQVTRGPALVINSDDVTKALWFIGGAIGVLVVAKIIFD